MTSLSTKFPILSMSAHFFVGHTKLIFVQASQPLRFSRGCHEPNAPPLPLASCLHYSPSRATLFDRVISPFNLFTALIRLWRHLRSAFAFFPFCELLPYPRTLYLYPRDVLDRTILTLLDLQTNAHITDVLTHTLLL